MKLKQPFTCFVYGEGGNDKHFLMNLFELKKFKYHTNKWRFTFSNASGSSAETVLDKCKKEIQGISYQLVLCFIDLDKLKHDYKNGWEKEKVGLEKKYDQIKVIWQKDKLEDELKKVLGKQFTKRKLNNLAKLKIKEFINSNFWNRILNPIKEKEAGLIKKSLLLNE